MQPQAASDTPSLLVTRESPIERWQLYAASDDSGVRIYCATNGENTLDIFGSPWHVSCATISSAHTADLLRALNGPLGIYKSLEAGLRGLFADEDICFSDLLDLLDGHKVPYAYASHAEQGILFRPATFSAQTQAD